ncbi:MAG TPA: cytochrome c [Terriglobales bacterium]|nr:cytochrome c [Terriglobales bacterium]
MRLKLIGASIALALISVLCVAVDSPRSGAPTTAVAQNEAQTNAMRLEGEKRFHANCSRCHAAPQKFPPRMMATIVRHMRVRATITDEDMRLVLFYMTQ